MLTILIAVAIAAGVKGLADAVGWQIAVAALAVAVLAAFAGFNEVAGRVVGGIVVGTLALVGFNLVVDWLFQAVGWERGAIVPGLAVAVVVFGVTAGWYLRGNEEVGARGGQAVRPEWSKPWTWSWGRGKRWGVWWTSVTAATLALLLILDVPILVARGKESYAAIGVGLGLALVLCGLGVWCRLKREKVPVARRFGGIAAPVVGIVGLAVLPVALMQQGEGDRVPDRKEVASKVDVRIVTDGSSHPAPGDVSPDPALGGFNVEYSVGVREGDGVRWTLVGSPSADEALRVAATGRAAPADESQPVTRKGADPVLVMLVDGNAPAIQGSVDELPNLQVQDKPGEWRRVARAAGGRPAIPAFALLQTTRARRLDKWDGFVERGRAVSIQRHGRGAVTEAALALAIGAPTAEADLALAVTHRPLLLFDRTEPVPRPLSVAWLFRDGRVYLCRDGGVPATDCDENPTRDPQRLENNQTHLRLDRPDKGDLQEIAKLEANRLRGFQPDGPDDAAGNAPAAVPGTAPSAIQPDPDAAETAIYVHTVPVERNGKDLLYLDYWWYLPDNPVTVGMKGFCGAGLVIPGITCHDHESDWEGMTVVVDRSRARPRVEAVHYAQHSDVVWYSWDRLRDRWDADPDVRRIVDAADNGAQRPLAFVASGSHASYPFPCRAEDCKQFATRVGENAYRGGLPWIGNFTNVCGTSTCVHRVPTYQGGQHPALWNAFEGPWGEQHCALRYYCDSTEPPKAPGQQGRYQHPTRCTGVADKEWRFKRRPCDE